MEDKNNLTWEKSLKQMLDSGELVFKNKEERKQYLKPSNTDIPIEEVFSEEVSDAIKKIQDS